MLAYWALYHNCAMHGRGYAVTSCGVESVGPTQPTVRDVGGGIPQGGVYWPHRMSLIVLGFATGPRDKAGAWRVRSLKFEV